MRAMECPILRREVALPPVIQLEGARLLLKLLQLTKLCLLRRRQSTIFQHLLLGLQNFRL